MKNKKVIRILLFFLIIMIMIINISNAMSIGTLKGNTNDTADLQTMGDKVVRIVSTIGSISSVIVIIVLGIKYMLGSVEEKAEYKKTLVPFLIGAVFIFSASTIAGLIYEFAIKINKWYNVNSNVAYT